MIPVLTLDGPSGVGKGTVASIVAQKLDWHLLDSGAIYRAFAIVAKDNDINIDDIDGLLKLANNFDISFKLNSNNKPLNVYLDNVEVSSELRTEKTAALASQFAKIKPLRNCNSLNNNEIKNLIFNIKKILKFAIFKGGSSVRDFQNTLGKSGNFQHFFHVYGQKNKKCSRISCKGKIKKIVISNRSSFYCNRCQI